MELNKYMGAAIVAFAVSVPALFAINDRFAPQKSVAQLELLSKQTEEVRVKLTELNVRIQVDANRQQELKQQLTAQQQEINLKQAQLNQQIEQVTRRVDALLAETSKLQGFTAAIAPKLTLQQSISNQKIQGINNELRNLPRSLGNTTK